MGLGNILVLAQVTGYTLTLILSFFMFVPLSVNTADFDGHCLLYSTGKWFPTNKTDTGSELEIHWGDPSLCNFPVFVSVLALPLSVLYMIWYGICMFKGIAPSWCASFTCLAVCLLMTVLMLICGCILSMGFKSWCNILWEGGIICEMGEFVHFKIEDYSSLHLTGYFAQFGMAQFGAWGGFICWTFLSGFVVAQLYLYHQQEDFFVSMYRERERLIQKVSTHPEQA